VIEVELKARVADRAAVEARVASFARPAGDVDKLDAYWHGPEWRLQRGARGFRLRREGGNCVVTFKSKRGEGGIEINREREFEISDPDAFVEFAYRIGCEPFYTKRKRGLKFVAEAEGGIGPAAIEIVDVQGLGDFIEIEVLLLEEDPMAISLAQGEIRSLLARAGVREEAIESRYYSELLMAAGLVARP
jgi:predicted adenylyl cyclase CyaB